MCSTGMDNIIWTLTFRSVLTINGHFFSIYPVYSGYQNDSNQSSPHVFLFLV